MRMSTLLAIVTGALVAASGAPGASHDPVQQALQEYADIRAALEAAVNEQRAEEGLEPVAAEPRLARAAQEAVLAIAERLKQEGVRFAEAVEEAALDERLAAAGYEAHAYAMSVAVSDGPSDLVASRLMAAGRDELRRPDLPDVGIGVAPSWRSRVYLVVVAQSTAGHFAAETAALGSPDAVRSRLLERTNERRLEAGSGRVEPDACLERVAQAYAERMLAEGFFSHFDPSGEAIAERVRQGGCRFRPTGENLAKGPTRVDDVVAEWAASESHRRVLLDPRFDAMGLGLALGRGPDGYHAVWVQVFGARAE